MAIKRLMAKALPDYLVNQVTSEVRLATRRMFTARSVRRSLASQKGSVLGTIEVYHRRARGFPNEEVELLARALP